MNNSLKLTNVSFSYGKNKALENINLEIEKGSFVCILGANASGKSTLAKVLNGLLKPTSGTVERNEKTVSLVFQNPDNQIVASIVEDDTAFGPENLGFEQEKIINLVANSLKQVSMDSCKNHPTKTLSGGEKQRICIAGSLAMDSMAIVLDEPCSMLDPQGKEDVSKTLTKLNKRGCTIVLITHDLDLAMKSDRAIVLSEGKIVLDCVPQILFDNPQALLKFSLCPSPAMELRAILNQEGSL